MKNIPGRILIWCLLVLTCFLQVVEAQYNIVSREATVSIGKVTSTNHVRQFVSREVTVGMGEATSTAHVRNIISREYTVGRGAEVLRLYSDVDSATGMVEFKLDVQFIQNPLQMSMRWSLGRVGGATVASDANAEWEDFSYLWDTAKCEEGVYDMQMRFVRPDRDDVVLTRRYLVWREVDGASIYSFKLWKIVNGKDVLVGSTNVQPTGCWDISEYETDKAVGTTYHWQVVAYKGLEAILMSDLYSFRTFREGEYINYAFCPGWNLVSVPFEIDEETGGGELLSMSPMVYEKLRNTYVHAAESMKAGTAAWLFSRETQSLMIWTDKAASGGPSLPPELSKGWNLAGICGTQELLLDCEVEGVSAIWAWNGWKFVAVPIDNGSALLEPGVGYWIYLEK